MNTCMDRKGASVQVFFNDKMNWTKSCNSLSRNTAFMAFILQTNALFFQW